MFGWKRPEDIMIKILSQEFATKLDARLIKEWYMNREKDQ